MAQTRARAPPGSGRAGPTRRSAAGTPARTADGSSASWTLLSAPTMGCPRNRVNSNQVVGTIEGFRKSGLEHLALSFRDVRLFKDENPDLLLQQMRLFA